MAKKRKRRKHAKRRKSTKRKRHVKRRKRVRRRRHAKRRRSGKRRRSARRGRRGKGRWKCWKCRITNEGRKHCFMCGSPRAEAAAKGPIHRGRELRNGARAVAQALKVARAPRPKRQTLAYGIPSI